MLRTYIFAVTVAISQTLASEAQGTLPPNRNCKEFSNTTFTDEQAIGAWHMMLPGKRNFTDDNCLEFSKVSEQTLKELQASIGKLVENMNWANLTLKMRVPCSTANTTRVQEYYLERLNDNGYFLTLQVTSVLDKSEKPVLLRYPMWLKVIEKRFLGMMDCRENVVFVLGHPTDSTPEDADKVQKVLNLWPEY